MATVNYVSNPIRMSVDTMITKQTNEVYSGVAKKDGIVKSIDKNGLIVEYLDGSIDKFPLGIYYGKGAGETHKHNRVTDLKVGDKFSANDDLIWDDLFFERDLFNKGKSVLKMGVMSRTALIEDQTTFEDSIAITKRFAKQTSIPYVKPIKFKVRKDQIVTPYIKVGDEVRYDQIIIDIGDITTELDTDAFSGIERYGIKQIRPEINGIVTKITVTYNGEVSDFIEQTGNFIKKLDKERKDIASYLEDEASNGNIGGNTQVKKTKLYPGTAEFIVYVEQILESTTSDKLVYGNQMKGTIGYIYPFDIKTLDGRIVHSIFSTKSLLARMVLSMRDKLSVNELNNVYTNRLVERIEGESSWPM